MTLNISPGKDQILLTDAIVRMVEGTVQIGMSPDDAISCLATGAIQIFCNFKDPKKELELFCNYLSSPDAVDAIKFYKKQRRKK